MGGWFSISSGTNDRAQPAVAADIPGYEMVYEGVATTLPGAVQHIFGRMLARVTVPAHPETPVTLLTGLYPCSLIQKIPLQGVGSRCPRKNTQRARCRRATMLRLWYCRGLESGCNVATTGPSMGRCSLARRLSSPCGHLGESDPTRHSGPCLARRACHATRKKFFAC